MRDAARFMGGRAGEQSWPGRQGSAVQYEAAGVGKPFVITAAGIIGLSYTARGTVAVAG